MQAKLYSMADYIIIVAGGKGLRMGGDVPVVAYDGHRRIKVIDMMAERTAKGETLVLALDIDSKEEEDA